MLSHHRTLYISLLVFILLLLSAAPPLAAGPTNGAQPNLRTGIVTNVSNTSWTPVTLDVIYASMVVVASPNYGAGDPPLVVRIRSANPNGSSFEMKLDRVDNSTAPTTAGVYYMVVEEGAYTVAEHGIKMEAATFTSTITDHAAITSHTASWLGQSQTYSSSYTAPVVVGQVMTANDSSWSSFWACGSTPTAPPSSSAFYAGKMVGQDSTTTRANETIGYIVFESGQGTIDGLTYAAGVGADIVGGMSNAPPYAYPLTGFQSVTSAVVSSAGMDGADGGWPLLYGSTPLTTTALKLAIDEDQLFNAERGHTAEQVAYVVFGVDSQPKLRTGSVTNVSNTSWTPVTLDVIHASMVVVASPNYGTGDPPLVVRICSANPAGNSFEMKLDRVDNSTAPTTAGVYYIVVEEGAYTAAEHGIKMEAATFTSTITDHAAITSHAASWLGQSQTYSNSYTAPVVVGQVMTANDSSWSSFWARGSTRGAPPSSTAFYAGKMVGQDNDTTRANETIGYIVFESGQGTIDGLAYAAGVGADTVGGTGNAPPYAYPLTGFQSVTSAVVSSAGMDGADGGWPLLYGSTPLTTTALNLAIDEDQLFDAERGHTAEQVAYIVFGPVDPNALNLAGIRTTAPNSAWPLLIVITLLALTTAVFARRRRKIALRPLSLSKGACLP